LILFAIIPDKKTVAINCDAIIGQNKSITATQTDKQVRQSKGFNL
jgi:hypothetical protein